jgi:hypothetical protein
MRGELKRQFARQVKQACIAAFVLAVSTAFAAYTSKEAMGSAAHIPTTLVSQFQR